MLLKLNAKTALRSKSNTTNGSAGRGAAARVACALALTRAGGISVSERERECVRERTCGAAPSAHSVLGDRPSRSSPHLPVHEVLPVVDRRTPGRSFFPISYFFFSSVISARRSV
jgi:hypothetical protein